MLDISNEDIMEQTVAVSKAVTKGAGALLESVFLQKSGPILEQREKRTYPYEVRIPKSLNDMLEGDFRPEMVITVEKPFEGPYSHMWFGDSTDGIALRCGYKNGDSRYINDVTLGDATVHGIMGGATGQGKSVALNSIIYGVCYEYAPWEVRLTLSDAKIVEFKSIAANTPLPHIDTVAATGDVDYLLSVLQCKKDEMDKINSVFVTAGKKFGKDIKNIKSFRKYTGLMLPQNLLIFDEFQTLFKAAAKLTGKVIARIDDFVRLGRNTGFHLLLASQELGSDLPTATLNNITCRAALGCQASVSEQIIGNDEAKTNLGKKGYLIFNLSSQNNQKADNSLVRVPFIEPETIEIYNATKEAALKVGFKRLLNFYDEQAFKREKEYEEWLYSLPYDPARLYLGEPSFIMDSEIQAVALNLDGKDLENVCVLASNVMHQLRLVKMLMLNVKRNSQANNLILCLDDQFDTKVHIRQLSEKFFYTTRTYDKNPVIDIARSLIYRRHLCLEADAMVFSNAPYTDESDKIFYTIYDKGSPMDTVTYRSRFFCIYGLLCQDEQYIKAFGLDGLSVDAAFNQRRELAKNCLDLYSTYNADESKLEMSAVPPIYVWVLGVNKLLGIGRDSNSRKLQDFKKLLQDAYLANIRFIMTAATMGDLTEIRDAFRWYLMDDLTPSETSRIKCDDYPAQKSAGLAVLYDTMDKIDPCKKFKKMIFDDELPPL